MYSEKTNI